MVIWRLELPRECHLRRIVVPFVMLVTVRSPESLAAQAKPHQPMPSVADLARSVVKLEVDLLDGSTASGSGVIVDASGLIATAAHVLAGARAARVRLASGEVMKAEGVVDADVDLDLALIRIAGFQLPTAVLGNSDSLQLGQRLLAIGAPLGFESTVTDGLLSSVRSDRTRRLLQISIPVSHGSSGGPVFTERGEVVGLVVSGFRADVAQELNFALPINYVRGKLALAASKTPIPFAQAAITMPPSPTVGEASPTSGGAPETVNANLGLDWAALNGSEVFQEFKGERGIRRIGLARYSLSSDPSGQPVILRDFTLRTRVKVAALRTDDVADDAIVTELRIGSGFRVHESGQRTSYVAAVQGGRTDLLIEGRQFSWTALNGETRTGAVPSGTLTAQLVGGAVAALPDSLPPIAFIWVFDPATGRAEATRFEFGRRDQIKIPLVVNGQTCGPDAMTRDSTVSVVWVTSTTGPNRSEYPVLAERPHLRVHPDDAKCIRRPGWGGAPKP